MPSFPGGIGLMIGVPLSGKPIVPEMMWNGPFNTHPPMNMEVRYSVVKGRPVAEARNQIGEAAITNKCKYLYFQDSDVTVPAHLLRQLIFHLDHWPKYAVVGGIYCHKSIPQMPMVFRGNGIGPFWDWAIGEVFDVSGIGMGATLIRVDALKECPKPWFRTIDDTSKFLDGIPQAELWTEDLWFAHQLSQVKNEDGSEKWKIMADGGLLCTHWDIDNEGHCIPFNLPLNSKPYMLYNQKLGVAKGSKKIVDLGCGAPEDSYQTSEGQVIRVDIRDEVNPDYRCDLRQLPFNGEEFDIVFSSHVLEHFPRAEFMGVLQEMVRILKKDGELRLVLPNLEWAARHIVNGEVDADVMNVIYGAQSYAENFHMVGFTPKMIEQALAQLGFVKFDWTHNGYHMLCRGWRNPPVNPTILASIVGLKNVRVEDKNVEIAQDNQIRPTISDPGNVLSRPDTTAEIEPATELPSASVSINLPEQREAASGNGHKAGELYSEVQLGESIVIESEDTLRVNK